MKKKFTYYLYYFSQFPEYSGELHKLNDYLYETSLNYTESFRFNYYYKNKELFRS